MMILDSEGWVENTKQNELVFTGYRNYLMPLIRYKTGDEGKIETKQKGIYLKNIIGRTHDLVPISGVVYPTHHIMDILDHRVGGIQEFQIDMRSNPPILRLALEPNVSKEEINQKILQIWPQEFLLEYVGQSKFTRHGQRAKFRHVVTSPS